MVHPVGVSGGEQKATVPSSGGSKEVTPVELERLKRVFDWIDTKKDGVLDLEEVHTAFHRLGYKAPKLDVEQYIWEVDDDLDGTISWDEYLVMYQRCIFDTTGLEPRGLFTLVQFLLFDKDFKGKISVENTLQILFVRYGRERLDDEIREIFGAASSARIDTGEEATITFTDFQTRSNNRLRALRSSRGKLDPSPLSQRSTAAVIKKLCFVGLLRVLIILLSVAFMTVSLLELKDALMELREAEALLNTKIRVLEKLPCSPWIDPSKRASVKPAFALFHSNESPLSALSHEQPHLPASLSPLLRKRPGASPTAAAAGACGDGGSPQAIEISEEARGVFTQAEKMKHVCDQAMRDAAKAEKLEDEIRRLNEEASRVFTEMEEAEINMPNDELHQLLPAPLDAGVEEETGISVSLSDSSDLRLVYRRETEELVVEGPEDEKALVVHLFEGLPRRRNWWSKPLCDGPNLHELVKSARDLIIIQKKNHVRDDAAAV